MTSKLFQNFVYTDKIMNVNKIFFALIVFCSNFSRCIMLACSAFISLKERLWIFDDRYEGIHVLKALLLTVVLKTMDFFIYPANSPVCREPYISKPNSPVVHWSEGPIV